MLLSNRHGHPSRAGATLDHVRLNEATTHIAFGGRRRGVYTCITALSGARPGDRVLDIGCGGGYLARLLAAAVAPGGQVTGLDTSAPAIGYARKRASANCSFVLGVAQDLPWPDGSFDVVASTLAAPSTSPWPPISAVALTPRSSHGSSPPEPITSYLPSQ